MVKEIEVGSRERENLTIRDDRQEEEIVIKRIDDTKWSSRGRKEGKKDNDMR